MESIYDDDRGDFIGVLNRPPATDFALGVDIGECNLGLCLLKFYPESVRIFYWKTICIKDPGDTLQTIITRMITSLDELFTDFSKQCGVDMRTCAIYVELQGKTCTRNRILQHAIGAYCDTLNVCGIRSWGLGPEAAPRPMKFVQPRDKFRVQLRDTLFTIIPTCKKNMPKKYEARNARAIEIIHELQSRIEYDGDFVPFPPLPPDAHMADAFLTAMYRGLVARRPKKQRPKKQKKRILRMIGYEESLEDELEATNQLLKKQKTEEYLKKQKIEQECSSHA